MIFTDRLWTLPNLFGDVEVNAHHLAPAYSCFWNNARHMPSTDRLCDSLVACDNNNCEALICGHVLCKTEQCRRPTAPPSNKMNCDLCFRFYTSELRTQMQAVNEYYNNDNIIFSADQNEEHDPHEAEVAADDADDLHEDGAEELAIDALYEQIDATCNDRQQPIRRAKKKGRRAR